MYLPEYDTDARTKERRELVLKMALRNRCTNALMLHHPHEQGKEFVKKFQQMTGADVTIVDRKHVSKRQRKQYGERVKVLDHRDIINVLPTDKFDFLDFDFCGGMMQRYVRAIEANQYWNVMCLKISNIFRSNTDTPAIPKGEHVQTWVFNWCKQNGWNCQLNPIPYPRGGQGLWFYSFIITK